MWRGITQPGKWVDGVWVALPNMYSLHEGQFQHVNLLSVKPSMGYTMQYATSLQTLTFTLKLL